MADPLRVLLVGSRILPYRHNGDKNFWLDVLQRLPAKGVDATVLSITIDDDVPGSDLPIRYLRPIPVYLEGGDTRFNADHRFLTGTNNYSSKTLSLGRILRRVRELCRELRPDVVHFVDNYGPATVVAREALGSTRLAISAPTYDPNRFLYDTFLRMSFRSFDAIVPFSEAYGQRLCELGFEPRRIHVIRWGVDTDRFAPATPEERASARRALGVDEDTFLVIWTGFIQQTGERDLAFTLRTAEHALREDSGRITFAICFKGEHFRDEFRRYERAGLRVFRRPEEFRAARAAADLLHSSIVEPNSTAAPPLVWVESLALGIPISTTPVLGGQEAVVPGESGFAARTPEESARQILELASDPGRLKRLREGARRVAVERFSVDRSVDEHVELWSRMAVGEFAPHRVG